MNCANLRRKTENFSYKNCINKCIHNECPIYSLPLHAPGGIYTYVLCNGLTVNKGSDILETTVLDNEKLVVMTCS